MCSDCFCFHVGTEHCRKSISSLIFLLQWKRWLLSAASDLKWAGVFLLASAEGEQISFLLDCVVRGLSPSRGPSGLRPVLPDPSASQTVSEEKLNHEAEELEKRLSMLSHASSSYCPGPGGDDRSISGSSDTSDTSQSDGSVGSRLAIWTEPASNPPEGAGLAGGKAAPQTAEKLSVAQGAGSRPAAKPPRQLQDIGRQSSSDSGIATGSHSSYSGSFSSYTGSLDTASGEDFGSVFNLPPHSGHDLSPCSCPAAHGHDYQVPTSLRYLYDTPRSLLQDDEASAAAKHTPPPSSVSAEAIEEDRGSTAPPEGHPERQSIGKSLRNPPEESKRAKAAPSSDSFHACSSVTSVSKTIVTVCSVCGGFKRSHGPISFLSGSVFVFPPEAPLLDRPRSDCVTYVNIPISPTSKKQLNYMELELQEPPPHGAARGTAASTKYVQIDIAATETAHKVGAQHALGRQEGLHTLELRRKATPH
uniref:Docking protein 7 n=1 Tax=Salarias fasciatus TaxID=181472 RepID=A0A672H7K0_SALFA